MFVRSLLSALLIVVCVPLSAAEPAWQSFFDQANLEKTVGAWTSRDGELRVSASPGARVSFKVQPAREYDFRVTFTRTSGIHSIALMFVVDGHAAVCDIDAWGKHLAGIQKVDGRTLRERPTPPRKVTLKNNEKSTVLIEVRKDEVRVIVDGELIDSVKGDGSNLSIVDEWRLPTATLGVGSWEAATTFHAIDYRALGDTPVASSTGRPIVPMATSPGSPSRSRPTGASAGSGSAKGSTPSRMTPPAAAGGQGEKPRVLIVIANQDFFYREYADPRQELERAGFQVEIGAARKGPCRPHNGSGQGQDGGTVQADVALADVRPDRYVAILFAGGWGASQYQYAFRGRYQNGGYNGSPEVKSRANELINQFVNDDKYVAGLCHGVSVLAWSRVGGKSLLDGRAVCAATLPSPNGQHPGASGVPASRWHAEVNGARLHPGNAVGNPNSSSDDVAVDGKIVTGQDDHSARELGRKLAELLKGS